MLPPIWLHWAARVPGCDVVTGERLNDQGMWLCSIGPGQQACSQAGDESTACIARSWLGSTSEPAASY